MMLVWLAHVKGTCTWHMLNILSHREKKNSRELWYDSQNCLCCIKEPCLTWLGFAFYCRKGLSQFYSGKSRSFSCLGDVVSLKEIVKPENPYARKRKHNFGGSGFDRASRLPPLQKGIGSITKRSLHNSGKSKAALGVALSSILMNEDGSAQECEASSPPWGQRKSVASRSFSLSDLQGVCGVHESQYRGS